MNTVRTNIARAWAIAITAGALAATGNPAGAQSPDDAAPPGAQVSTSTPALDRAAWTGSIGAAQVIRVDNPWGDIRLRHGGPSGQLEVVAALQQLASDGSSLELEVSPGDSVVQITIKRNTESGSSTATPATGEGDRSRGDLAVLVPAGVEVSARTTYGAIDVRGVHVDLDLETESGTIRVLKSHGRVTGRSDRGAIEATLLSGVTKDPQSLSTSTGAVTAFIPADADLAVSIATSGTITTDYSLEIEHIDHQEPDKVAAAQIGDGGPKLSLASTRGDVALRRVPVAERPSPGR